MWIFKDKFMGKASSDMKGHLEPSQILPRGPFIRACRNELAENGALVQSVCKAALKIVQRRNGIKIKEVVSKWIERLAKQIRKVNRVSINTN